MKYQLVKQELSSGSRNPILPLLRAMRPADWIKNVFVAAPLFFSGQAVVLEKVFLTGLVMVAFCAMSSAVYLFNDINDREHDQLHPKKSYALLLQGSSAWGLLWRRL